MIRNSRSWLPSIAALLLLFCCSPAGGLTETAGDNPELLSEIRPVVEAFLNGGPAERAAQVAYVTTACTTADGLGGPPKCEAGEADGTEVTALPVSGAEGSFARPEGIEQAFEFSVEGLYAVYQAPPTNDPPEYWPRGEYALLFERPLDGFPSPITALIEGGKIVRLDYPMGVEAAAYFEGIAADQVLLSPEDAAALSAKIAGGGHRTRG